MRHLRLSVDPITPGRLQLIDELKGFAIILVVLYHAGGVVAWENKLHGELGVDIFAILSGVGLSLSSTVKSAGQYFGRRFLRIYPMYWLVLTAFLLGNAYFMGEHTTTKDIVLHYIGIHAFWSDTYAVSINDSFWFITFIIFVYTVYWLIKPLWNRPDWIIAIGSILTLVMSLTFLYGGHALMFGHLVTRVPQFFIGLLIGQLIRNGRLEIPLNVTVCLSVFILLYVAYLNSIIYYIIVLAPVMMGLYAFAFKPILPVFIAGPVGKIFAFLGRYSLEIFLIHQPLIRHYNLHFQYTWFKITPPTIHQMIIGMVIWFIVVVIPLSVGLGKLQQWMLSSKKTA